MNANLTAVVAYDKGRGIARSGKIPWDLPLDRAVFRFMSEGLPLVLGRVTADQMKFPLPNRKVYVLSGQPVSYPSGVEVYGSVSQLMDKLPVIDDVIIAGGQTVFEQFLPDTKTIIATEVNASYECDRFFPPIDSGQWDATLILRWEKDEFHKESFEVVRYERKPF